MKNVKLIIILLILAGAGYYGYKHFIKKAETADAAQGAGKSAAGKPGAPAGMPPMGVLTEKVTSGKMSRKISAIGTLQAWESADLRAEVAGVVISSNLQEGKAVKKGDVLVQLDDSLLRADVAKAEATYAIAESTYNRTQKLLQSRVISNQQFDNNALTYRQSKAALDSVKITLSKSAVRAPFDGVAGLRQFSVGDYIQVGTLLTTLDKIDVVKVDFAVPEKNFSNIRLGQKIMLETDAFPGRTFEGKIYAIDSRIDPNNRNFHVVAQIDNNDATLRSGMYARVQVSSDVVENVLQVPEESIIPVGKETFVFVVKDGKAVNTHVVTDMRESGLVSIREGLTEGEDVVVEGVLRIRDGAPVMAQPRGNADPAKTSGAPVNGQPQGQGVTSSAAPAQPAPATK